MKGTGWIHVALTLLVSQACVSTNMPIEYEKQIRVFYREAQEDLASNGLPIALEIPIEIVHRWVPRDGPFRCGGVLANGCFSGGKHRIEFNTQTVYVIRHESKHAILHRLGHPCGKDHSCELW